MRTKVKIIVKEVKGKCALGYKPGDTFLIDKYYIPKMQNVPICLHALLGMSTLLSPFLKGVSAKDLGISDKEDVGYVQCPDPGKPYTDGGTVVFELKRENVGNK